MRSSRSSAQACATDCGREFGVIARIRGLADAGREVCGADGGLEEPPDGGRAKYFLRPEMRALAWRSRSRSRACSTRLMSASIADFQGPPPGGGARVLRIGEQ
eukprot:7364579-Prymnesium_polylepis.1